MKINPSSRPVATSRAEAKTQPDAEAQTPPTAGKGWVAGAGRSEAAALHTAKKAIAGAATHAVATALTEHSAQTPAHQHPLLERFGQAMGLGLGVIVTEALALAPGWNKPLVDPQGTPVAHIEGADRIGDHDLKKRHEEVVGPKVTALVEKLPPGAIHDILEGFGKGATEAPGASYRLESAIADLIRR